MLWTHHKTTYPNQLNNVDIQKCPPQVRIDTPDRVIFIVCELSICLHHVVHGDEQFPDNSIFSFLLFVDLLLEIVAPYTEHLVIAIYEAMVTHVQRLMQWFATFVGYGAWIFPVIILGSYQDRSKRIMPLYYGSASVSRFWQAI